MGIRQDIVESFKEFKFTKIDGQPTNENVNQLVRELTEAAASIPTTNGGGDHGHIGMITLDAEYITFSTGDPISLPQQILDLIQLPSSPMQQSASTKSLSTRLNCKN